MRRRTACLVLMLAISPSFGTSALAQLSTPRPERTAESESWYLSGAPINVAGTIYYPSGPVIHFNRNEMVFTGLFELVPVYKRTTEEPGSIVYVPLSGGLVRPYERRRSGELAGTVGSSAPSFPVVLRAEAGQAVPGQTFFGATVPVIPRPVGTTGFLYGVAESEPGMVGLTDPARPAVVGTGGSDGSAVVPPAALHSEPARIQTVQRPVGLNAVYIEFEGRRWHAAGPAVELAPDRFSRSGDYRGFAVYQQRGRTDRIFVATVFGEPALLVPYESR